MSRAVSVLLVFAIWLAGCGGGGAGSGSGDTTPAETRLLPYIGLEKVDGQSTEKPAVLDVIDIAAAVPPLVAGQNIDSSETAQIRQQQLFFYGDYSAEDFRLSQYHANYLIYSNQSRLYRLTLMGEAAGERRQLSAEEQADRICARDWLRGVDYRNRHLSRLVYRIAADCSQPSQGGEWRMIHIGDDASSAPQTLPASISRPTWPLHSGSEGSLIGWLALEGQALMRYDRDFNASSAELLSNGVQSIAFLNRTPDKGYLFLIGRDIYRYNAESGLLDSSPLYTGGDSFNPFAAATMQDGCSFQNFVSDRQFVYFVDGMSLYSLSMNSGQWSELATESQGIDAIWLSENQLYYTSGGLGVGGAKLWSLSKTGGQPTVEWELDEQDFFTCIVSSEDYLVAGIGMNTVDGIQGREVRFFRDVFSNAPEKSEIINDAKVLGLKYSNQLFPDSARFIPEYVVLQEGTFVQASRQLVSYSLASANQRVTIGELPPFISGVDGKVSFFWTRGHDQGLISATAEQTSLKHLLFCDVNKSHSLLPVKNNGVKQIPIYN